MAAPSLVRRTFLTLFSILMTTEVFSSTVTPRPDSQTLICTKPGYQYARHPLDCSRWFHCPNGHPVEMPACIDSMTFSMISLTCLPRRNESNDCVSTCEFDGKLRYLGETFVGRNSCESCICQNNRGIVVCSNACLSKGATCSYSERIYKVGQYFMYPDGCNTCICEEEGVIRCTDIKCQTNKVTCYHQESVYVAGETFPHLDGQHTCTCRLDGVVSCSLSHAGRTEDETSCLYDQKRRRANTVFLSVDHCNQCECLGSGNVTCTKFNCSSPRTSLNERKALNSVTPTNKSIASPPTAQMVVVCYYEQNEYRPGDTFTATDGCNTCSCSLDGKVHCTKKLCPQPPVSNQNQQNTCFYDGQRYKFRDHFNSTDGCNTCYCTRDGRVQCTELTCLPIWNRMPDDQAMCTYGERDYLEGESFFAMDGCNYCSCGQYGQVECTARDCQSTSDTTMATTTATTMPTTLATTMATTTATTTLSTIARPLHPTNVCVHKGRQYNVGETFSTPCDICYCSINRHVHCIRLTCPPEPDVISKHSPSEVLQPSTTTPRVISTASVNNVLSSSSDEVSTKATSINIPKLPAIDGSGSVTESNRKRPKHSLTTIPFTSGTPLRPDESLPLEKSTVATVLELNNRHTTHQTFLATPTKNTTSHKPSSLSATSSTAPLQNIFVENATLLWNLDSQKPTLELPSVLAHTQSKKKFASSSESETSLSSILLSLLNFPTRAEYPVPRKVEYSKLISTDTSKTERSSSPELSTFTTSNIVALATTSKSDTIANKGVTAELEKADINENSTNNLDLMSYSVTRTSDPNESTMSAVSSAYTNPGLATQTVQNESRDVVTLPGLSMISADETLHSETSTKNKTESSSSSPDTTTDLISSLSNPSNSTFKDVSKPSLIATTSPREFPSDITAQPESLSLPTLINTPTAISTVSQAAPNYPLTPSPSPTIATPLGTTVIPTPTDYNTMSVPEVAILNKSKPSVNKKPVAEPFTETSYGIVPGSTLSVSVNPFPLSSTDNTMQDRSPKSTASSVSALGSSTAASSVSTTETGTRNSDSVHVTGSRTPQDVHVSKAPDDTVYVSVQPSPLISNVLTTTPTSVVESSTSVFTTKTSAVSIYPNSAPFSSSPAASPPSKSSTVSSSTLADQGTPTTNDSNPFPSDKSSEVTFSIATSGTIPNRPVSTITANPFNQYITTTITRPRLETNTPIYVISKRTSVQPNTATNTVLPTRPIFVTPVTETYSRHLSELSITDSKQVSKFTSTTLKAITLPTFVTNEADLISSTSLSRTPKPLSHVITTPIAASTKPIPLNKTNVKLMPVVPEEPTLIPDPVYCKYNGQEYQLWDVFMSQDDCNTCECLHHGMIRCTEFSCRDQKERTISVPAQRMTPNIATTTKSIPTTPPLEAIPCFYNGMRYKLWDFFSSSDGCNTCDCLYHGFVECTDIQCDAINDYYSDYSQIPTPPETCKYKDQELQIGQTFLSEDKCTICNCTVGGHINCTNIHCPSGNIQLNDPKSKSPNKMSPRPMVSRRSSVTVASTTQKMTPTPVLKRALCWYNGLSYQSGDKFNSEDNCNTCTCMPDSLVTCTQLPCPNKNNIPVRRDYSQIPTPPETCKYKDKVHQIGQTFLSEDKCTICNCTVGGHINCTNIHCPSENIQLNDRKSKLPNKMSPRPMVSRRSSVTVASTTQKMTPTPVLKRALCWYNGLSYQSGDKFNSEDNCNTCTCMPDSLVTCTQLPCPNKNILSDDSSCAYNGHIYQNGQMFNSADGCNTCGCLYDGVILCTSQVCGFGKDKFKVPIVTNSPVKCSYNDKTYNAGDVFNSTEKCNVCNCTQNGQVECTQKACSQESERLQYDAPANVPVAVTCSFEGHPYKPRQVFPMDDGCNVCTCEDDGRVVCTNNKCLSNNNETRGRQNSTATYTTTTSAPNQPVPKLCSYEGQTFQPGDVFRAIDGCNSCNCTVDAEVKCTQKKCPLNIAGRSNAVADPVSFHDGVTCVYEGETYKPKQVFPASDGCNTCRCTDVGRIRCTDTLCPVKSNPSKGRAQLTAKNTSTTHAPILERCSYNRQTYREGDTFYSIDGCNLCNCSHNGVVKCDQKSCLPRNEEASKDVAMSVYPNVDITCFYDGQVYQPQQVFPAADGCNTCACSDEGQVHCTEAVCSDRRPPKEKPLQDGTSGNCIFGGKRYTVGDTFDMADGCNICGCSEGGNILCTNRTCYPGILQNRESPQTVKVTTPTPQVTRPKNNICHYNGHSYVSGRIFKAADTCNMCGCLLNGKVHCTKNICDLMMVQTTIPPRTSAVPKQIPSVKCRYFGQKYNVGQMFAVQDGCNKCACLAEGIVRCTKHRCEPPVVFCKHGGNVYFMGQAFADECNTCKCGVHGIITCTELHCGTEDDGRCEYNGHEHEMGDTFRSSDGCHLCTCSSNARISCRPIPCQVPRNRFSKPFGTSQERSEEEYSDD